jgi:hypothetical protein
LRQNDLVSTATTIDRLFDAGPDIVVPCSKRPLQRMPDVEDRALLIACLKQVTAAARPD